MTPTEERILNLVLEWDNTRYSVALALIEVELKREAKNLANKGSPYGDERFLGK